MVEIDYKEWSDYRNGYRYYVGFIGDRVRIKVVTYPDRDKVFETEMDRIEYNAFIDYIKGE